MDIVRLVLERAKTSKEAVEIAGALMEAHGQGGNCEEGGSWCYENGFLFADSNEAWVFETAGIHWWAAERVGKGKSRNISNGITIRKPDMMHAGLASHAIAKGWWKGTPEDFDWKVAMLGGSSSAAELEPEGRERAGKEWLAKLSGPGKSFTWRDMATILRDTDSGICMTGGFESTGSQISVLHSTVEKPVHFFTTNSNPEIGCYKPFGFDAGLAIAQTPSRPCIAGFFLLNHDVGIRVFHDFFGGFCSLTYDTRLGAVEAWATRQKARAMCGRHTRPTSQRCAVE